MRYLELTLPDAAENLALDEALLEEAELAGRPAEMLRFWEPARPVVVVGRSSNIDVEVHRDVCRKLDIGVLRRISGGAAIVTGPGCLMYALVLSYELRPILRTIGRAHRFVLGKLAAALGSLVADMHCRGTSDLAIAGRKFSGNSVRCRRDHLLYHGTLLYDFPLELVECCLAMPPRQPDYRGGRPHESFMANLPLDPAAIRRVLRAEWGAVEPLAEWPQEKTARLATEKYSRRQWNDPQAAL